MNVQESIIQKTIIIINNRKILREFIIYYKVLRFLNEIKR